MNSTPLLLSTFVLAMLTRAAYGQGRTDLVGALDTHLSSNAVSRADRAAHLWWEAPVSLAERNRAFEREHRLPEGSVSRMLVERLEDEITNNTSQDTNTVPIILDGLLRSLPLLTNLMENALFIPSNRHVHAVMEACVLLETTADEGVAFMKTLLANMPPERRAACYAALGERVNAAGWPSSDDWRTAFTISILATFLETATGFDPDMDCLVVLDQALSKTHTSWPKRQARKRLADRHKDSGGEPGAYFKKLSDTLGPPAPPTWADVEQWLVIGWINGMEDMPDLGAVVERMQRKANRKFAFEFGLTQRETMLLMENKLKELAYAGQSTPADNNLMAWLLMMIECSGDAGSADVLLELIGKPGNHDLRQIILTYLKIAADIDGFMPMVRRAQKEFPNMNGALFSSGCWELVAGYAGRDGEKTEAQREIVGFLREETQGMADPYLSAHLDRSLLACDPAWAASAERERLARRVIDLPETPEYNVRYFTGVMKQFEAPEEPAAEKPRRRWWRLFRSDD